MKQTFQDPAYFILTRFNLPSKGYECLLRNEDWLRKRVDLFERYCLPSVFGQTDQDFSWIVYFDPQSPQWLLREVSDWQCFGQFKPVFRTEVSLSDKRYDFAAHARARRPRLITTNLDNDDGLSRDFVKRIKAAAPAEGRHALFIEQGLILNHDRIYSNRDAQNAFCSVVEDWDECVTCWAHPHNELTRYMPRLGLEGAPGWLQVVHGSNVSNRVHGKIVSPLPHAGNFVGIAKLPEVGRGEVFRDRWIKLPIRAVREWCHQAAKTAALNVGGRQGIERLKIFWYKMSALKRGSH